MASGPPWKAWYKTARWRNARLRYLQANPLCAWCEKAGKVTAASVVHHKRPHKGDENKFWDPDNWESLCKEHHDSAGQMEDLQGFSSEVGLDGWPVDAKHPANRM